MTRTTETTCDYCGKSVDYSGRDGHFVAVLSCYQREGVPNMMLVYPPVDGKMYFCNIECLRGWIDNGKKPLNYVQEASAMKTQSFSVGDDGTIFIRGDITLK